MKSLRMENASITISTLKQNIKINQGNLTEEVLSHIMKMELAIKYDRQTP